MYIKMVLNNMRPHILWIIMDLTAELAKRGDRLGQRNKLEPGDRFNAEQLIKGYFKFVEDTDGWDFLVDRTKTKVNITNVNTITAEISLNENIALDFQANATFEQFLKYVLSIGYSYEIEDRGSNVHMNVPYEFMHFSTR